MVSLRDVFTGAMVIEEQLFRAINSLAGQSPLVDNFMIVMSSGTTWVFIGLAILVVVLSLKSEKLVALFLAAVSALALTDLVSFRIVKPLFARERPCWLLEHVKLVVTQCGGSYGFTSNHAANAFAVWMMIALVCGMRSSLSLISITLATMVAISRVYLGVHFVGDIIGGAFLGIVIGLVANRLGLQLWSTKISRRLIGYIASSGK